MGGTPEPSHFCLMQEDLADSLCLGTPHQPGRVIPRTEGQTEALPIQASSLSTLFSQLSDLHLGLKALLPFSSSFHLYPIQAFLPGKNIMAFDS